MQLSDFGRPEWVQGIGSLLAVAVALGLAIEQRRTSARVRREALAREHRADRARLTFALSEIRNYAGKNVRATAALLDGHEPESGVHVPDGFELPSLHSESVRDVAKCISSSPDERQARAFGALLELAQIHRARLSRLDEKRGDWITPFEAAGHLYDSCELAAKADTFFGYARFEVEQTATLTTADDLETIARIEGIERYNETFKDFFFILDRRQSDRSASACQRPIMSG